MPEYRNNPNYRPQGGYRGGSGQPNHGQPSMGQQYQTGAPTGGQMRCPSGQVSPTSPIRQAPPRRPGGSYGYKQPKRHRRPTPFLIIFIVFIIILLAVIFTSRSFRGFIDGLGKDTETEAETDRPIGTDGTEPPETDEPVPEDSTVAVAPPEDDEFLICIDPGHGFGDIGASSELLGDVTEKDINLFIALEAYSLLKEAGYSVILTHDGKSFPKSPLDDGDELYYIDERTSYANSKKVDLFVSVHCDTFEADTSVSGTRIYYCSSNKYVDSSSVLADTAKRAINEAFPDYKEARVYGKEGATSYYVTRETKAPAILIELGFISNKNDAERMLDSEWRDNMAYAIANAVTVYLYESNTPTE